MRLYIIGPVTGMEGLNRPAFRAAMERLEAAGYDADIPHLHADRCDPWVRAMRKSVAAMVRCDGVALLDGWERSEGAQLERDVAMCCGIPALPVEAWLDKAEGEGGAE